MNKTPLVSIIVPVYKVEKYLYRCMNSILDQTFQDWECILVDDGSPDNCGLMCDEYSQKDNRFKVIHKENGGVSTARQVGLDIARGEYIIHVDSDDWVEPEMLEVLYSQTKDGSDIVISDFYIDINNKQQYIKQIDTSDSDTFITKVLEGKNMGSIWNKLIKRELYNNICFQPDLFYCEDVYVLTQMVLNKEVKIKNCHKAFYHYVQHQNSLVHQRTKNACENRWLFNEKIYLLLKNGNWANTGVLTIRKQKVLLTMLNSKNFTIDELLHYKRQIHMQNILSNSYMLEYMKNNITFYFRLFLVNNPRIYSILRRIKNFKIQIFECKRYC